MAETDTPQELLGHEFADVALMEAALTHGSSLSGRGDYQRLEFLGDRAPQSLSAATAFALAGA